MGESVLLIIGFSPLFPFMGNENRGNFIRVGLNVRSHKAVTSAWHSVHFKLKYL